MERVQIANKYSIDFLEIDRPSPLTDNKIESLIIETLSGKIERDISDNIYIKFKKDMSDWVFNSKINNLLGIEKFERLDIIHGCTQFIDNLYMSGNVQTLKNDYRYHQRLQLSIMVENIDSLKPNIPLLLALPFPSIGQVHLEIDKILTICLKRNIPVHIDGAWITCCRDIEFNFDHPAIHSVGISLSKGLGLGWNRIGLRWTRKFNQDSVTIMNDFKMINRALVIIGLHFIKSLPKDYLWNEHQERYYKVCKDFLLTPTNSIYLALKDNQPVGISPLIRFLENEKI